MERTDRSLATTDGDGEANTSPIQKQCVAGLRPQLVPFAGAATSTDDPPSVGAAPGEFNVSSEGLNRKPSVYLGFDGDVEVSAL